MILVLARIPFKIWKISSFFSMSSCSFCLCSFFFTGPARICDVMMSHTWIYSWCQKKVVFFNFFIYFCSFRSFRWFRFGRFVSLFRVLVHADGAWFIYSWVDMIYIDTRNRFATFWSVYSHSFKGLSTEQGDEKSHNRVCGQVFHRKYKRWPFMLAVSLEMFYRTTQKDTGKLKTFL